MSVPLISIRKMEHTTNYFDTFIEVADDCPVVSSEVPPAKDPRTAAQITFEMLVDQPYMFTSDDVLYAASGERRGLGREEFFSKGQPCMRSSPLTKRYGWGVHSDADGRIATFPMASAEYSAFVSDANLRHVKGMRSSRK